MNKAEQTKEQLIQAIIKLISEGHDPEELSARQIADEAGITFGLINYHFGTKQHLIQQACMKSINSKLEEMKIQLYKSKGEPIERLRSYLKIIANLSMQYHQSILRVMTKQELLEGEFETINYFLPIMKEIFPSTSENELKLLTYQLLVPLLFYFIRFEKINNYLELNNSNASSTDWIIDQSINNLLGGKK
ncbi:TetR/AcrR family transcriptional regulator [Clostridium sporogenes]|uniref:TetR/AcrR family transcriptional regulator n=1 Tax=Clostridium sporogenes TaxID=1509 RepID=UPI0028FE04A7|nr:TetR/AcrR family transcriptional regulator [Clostridium botulinum]